MANRDRVCGVEESVTTVALVPLSGRRVVARADTADEAAVQEIYRAHYGRLAGWATRLVGDPDIAHDLATEAFVRLLPQFGGVQEPRAWLYTVTGNLVRDHWRKRGREAEAYGRHEGGAEPDGGVDVTTRVTVREAVRSLPDRLRLCVMLYYFADLPVATIAKQIDRAPGTVKRDLFEARRLLAQLLEGDG